MIICGDIFWFIFKCDLMNKSYLGCLKSAYKDHCTVGNEFSSDGYTYTYPDCTMPWQQSMLDKHWSSTYNQDDVNACNQTQRSSLYYLDYEFLKQAAVLNITGCQGEY